MGKLCPDIVVLMRFEHWEVYFSVGQTPLVMECHSMCHCNLFGGTALQHSWVNLSKRLAKRAAVVVTLTEGDAKDWLRYANRVLVIPNVVHLNMSGIYSNQKSESVIFAGRISPQKDVFALLRIWKMVHDRHPDWALDIYGEGENEEQVRQEIEAMNANVILHAPTGDIMEKFRDSSMLVLTSEFEPFGLVMPEAMSCGLPVVAFDCPYGPASIITEGVDGFLIADRNEKDFADKICLLIENPDLRRQLGQAAIHSSQRYSADRIMPEWQKLFVQFGSKQVLHQ